MTESDAPLPPLPDGGLAAAMPAWLRADPAVPGVDAPPPAPAPVPATDPAGFLSVDDLPAWLRELDTPRPAALGPRPAPPSSPLAAAHAALPTPHGQERVAAEPHDPAPIAPRLPVTPHSQPPRGPATRPNRATNGPLIAGVVLLLLVIVCFLIARGIIRW